jgi:putative flippase GtrA
MIERYFPERHRALIGQIIRYGINGCIVTGALSLTFIGLDTLTHWPIQLCNFLAFLVAVCVGYNLHSRYTFKGQGERGWRAQLRFFLAALPSYAANAFWTWLLGTALHLPHWTIQVPIWVINPILLFAVNRWWVFK